MNRLTTEQRAQILGLMVEGMAIRAISRMSSAGRVLAEQRTAIREGVAKPKRK